MMQSKTSVRWRRVLDYMACYSLVFVVLLLALAVFFVWQGTAVVLITAMLDASSVNSLLYFGPLTLLGLVLFVICMAAEPYLVHGIAQRQLQHRFLQFAVPLISAVVLAELLRGWAITSLVNATH
ncbi:MAG: hypothetical protein H0X37_07935 [Herpetosiphonaceae bacterium]|nr:hypothetical protein [Herpetosiphonaceae bacterium]